MVFMMRLDGTLHGDPGRASCAPRQKAEESATATSGKRTRTPLCASCARPGDKGPIASAAHSLHQTAPVLSALAKTAGKQVEERPTGDLLRGDGTAGFPPKALNLKVNRVIPWGMV